MKYSLLVLALAAAAYPAAAQRNDRGETGAVDRACDVDDCFREADVRDFEVIDRTHLIVYVGPQRCAFHIELLGALCDMSFAPELYFRRSNEVPNMVIDRPRNAAIEPGPAQPRMGRRPTDFDTFELAQRERKDLRICGNDLMIQVHGGQWTESQAAASTDRFGNPDTDCRISSVTPVTDDQLVEFYVRQGVISPVPPMGQGEIEIGEQEAPEEQGAAPARERRRGGGSDSN
jgi:hypothetical protein